MAENSELYDLLVRVKNGYDPGWAYYSRYDDNLDDIRFNEKKPGLSSVNIVFSDYDDYLKLYSNLLDEDDIYYLKLFLSNQYQNDFDRYQLREEWEQGYVASYLNDENKELIDRIAYFISKDSVRMDFANKSKLLYKEYEGEIDNIMWEWSDIEHNCRMDIIQDEIIDEFSNKFYNLGIKEVVPLYKYKCSVNTLIRLFDMFGLQSETIFDLFKKIYYSCFHPSERIPVRKLIRNYEIRIFKHSVILVLIKLENYYHLEFLGVHPSCQGKGFGKKVLDFFPNLTLECKESLIPFYQKMGFTVLDKNKKYYFLYKGINSSQAKEQFQLFSLLDHIKSILCITFQNKAIDELILFLLIKTFFIFWFRDITT